MAWLLLRYKYFYKYKETETIKSPCEASVDGGSAESFCRACRMLGGDGVLIGGASYVL